LHAAQPERNITISIGIATHETGSTPNALMSRADQALYRAKELSKNRVEAQHPAGIKDKKAGVQD
jgi:diguanylate cyclase (GGDEF)-like protein